MYSKEELNFLRELKYKWYSMDEAFKKLEESKAKPKEEWFFEWAIKKTWEVFKWWISRIQEAWEWLSTWKYNFAEAAIRWWAWSLQSFFSPVSWVLWETLETWIEKIPQWFKDYIGKKANPTIQDAKNWYNSQTPSQKRDLDNIWVWVELLANFIWAGAVSKWTKAIKQVSPIAKTQDFIAKTIANKTALNQVKKISKEVPETIKQLPKKSVEIVKKTEDVIDTWVEKLATKMLWSSDWTKELFKATSPSYNTLSKNKDITKIIDNAKKADEVVVKYWFKPTNTSERVLAYEKTMKNLWSDIEKTRWWVKTKFDAKTIAKTIDEEIEKMSIWWVVNPALKKDITALKSQADYFRKIWKIDIPTLWIQRTLINTTIDWGKTTEFWNTFSNVMKKVSSQIRNVEDDIISKAWKWKVWDKLKEYWAVRSIYDDIVKQDIKALRAKWVAIDESFGRISWVSEAIWWIAQLFTNPKQALPTIVSWWSKLLLWKTAWKLKDTDFLIKTWYDKLSKTLKPNLKKNASNVDNNITTSIKYSDKLTKNSWWTTKPQVTNPKLPLKKSETTTKKQLETPKIIKKSQDPLDALWGNDSRIEFIKKEIPILENKIKEWRTKKGAEYSSFISKATKNIERYKDELNSLNKIETPKIWTRIVNGIIVPWKQWAIVNPFAIKPNIKKDWWTAMSKVIKSSDDLVNEAKIPKSIINSHIESSNISKSKYTAPNIVYRGISSSNQWTWFSKLWDWLYTAVSKSEAWKYGWEWKKILTLWKESIPNNPIRFDTMKDFENFIDYDIRKKLWIKSMWDFKEKYNIKDIIKQLWYDWISVWKWNERIFVKYN